MLPGCHSAMHVMVCEHSPDRLIAVSSWAPAQLPMPGMPSWGGSSSALVCQDRTAGIGSRTQGHLPCARTLQDFQQLKWKKSLTMFTCNSSRLTAQPDFHREREGCLPAKFQVAILKYEVDRSARKGTCQISPAFLFFFSLTIFLKHLNLLRCCHS